MQTTPLEITEEKSKFNEAVLAKKLTGFLKSERNLQGISGQTSSGHY